MLCQHATTWLTQQHMSWLFHEQDILSNLHLLYMKWILFAVMSFISDIAGSSFLGLCGACKSRFETQGDLVTQWNIQNSRVHNKAQGELSGRDTSPDKRVRTIWWRLVWRTGFLSCGWLVWIGCSCGGRERGVWHATKVFSCSRTGRCQYTVVWAWAIRLQGHPTILWLLTKNQQTIMPFSSASAVLCIQL